MGGYATTLLKGVTGSGKTEVYFEAVAEALNRGRQVLVLLPEIALTENFLRRFGHRFGVAPILWHSSLKSSERRRAWRAIVQGTAQVIVGARSALFLPYADLGLIVVDEAHEISFKQDDGVSFVHVATHETEHNPLTQTAAFARFQEGIRERCDQPPVVTELDPVGAYRFTGVAA